MPDQPSPRGPSGQFQRSEPANTIVDTEGIPPVDPGSGGTAGDKVIVACKHPNGLRLRLFRFVERWEPVMGGGTRKIDEAIPEGDEVVVHGNAFPYGMVPSWIIEGGFGFTENVSKEFWDKWVEQNRESVMVKRRLIWAMPQIEAAKSQARELKDLRSGLEPLDPQRLPRTGNPNVTLEPASRQ